MWKFSTYLIVKKEKKKEKSEGLLWYWSSRADRFKYVDLKKKKQGNFAKHNNNEWFHKNVFFCWNESAIYKYLNVLKCTESTVIPLKRVVVLVLSVFFIKVCFSDDSKWSKAILVNGDMLEKWTAQFLYLQCRFKYFKPDANLSKIILFDYLVLI